MAAGERLWIFDAVGTVSAVSRNLGTEKSSEFVPTLLQSTWHRNNLMTGSALSILSLFLFLSLFLSISHSLFPSFYISFTLIAFLSSSLPATLSHSLSTICFLSLSLPLLKSYSHSLSLPSPLPYPIKLILLHPRHLIGLLTTVTRGWLRSTEEAFLLLIQQPQVWILAPLRFFHFTAKLVDSI